MFNYQGSKQRIAKELIRYFPEHNLYVEPFFGSGAVFFAKPLAKYNILNDLDNEVFNFWTCIQEDKELLAETLKNTIVHPNVLKYQTDNKFLRAAIFGVKKCNTLYSAGETIRQGINNYKKILIEKINKYSTMENVIFNNRTAVECIRNLDFMDKEINPQCFIYSDPPYIGSEQRYNTPRWNESNLQELIEVQIKKGVKFAISEYLSHEDIFKQYNLNIIKIKGLQTCKNRNTEILVTNYEVDRLF